MRYTLLCDADEILYNAAFSVEKTAYKMIVKDTIYDFGTKYTKNQIINTFTLGGKTLKLDYDLQAYKIAVGPAAFALQCIKRILNKLHKLGDVKLFLTSQDKSNFRFGVAKTKGPNGHGYKEGRGPKPIYYNECREYLIKRGAEEVFGMEADDALGINQSTHTVLVHIDKDINRIAGKHYNWKTEERYIVEQPGTLRLENKNGRKQLKGTGNAFFFAQMLLGDRVDNIPSCNVGGDVKVFKLMENCSTEEHYFDVVNNAYYKNYGEGYRTQLYEMADLLYIMDSSKTRGSEYMKSFLNNKLITIVEESELMGLYE